MTKDEALRQAIKAMNAILTHMGMDEDSWNKPTFDQMRVAIHSAESALAAPVAEQPPGDPSEPDPLHLSRILHELAGSASLCWVPRPTGEFDSQTAIGFVEAAIAEIRARQAPAAEPVAWRLWPHAGDAKHWHYIERLDGNDTTGYTVQPLYAEPVACKPLTDEFLIATWGLHPDMPQSVLLHMQRRILDFARAVERAHGIE